MRLSHCMYSNPSPLPPSVASRVCMFCMYFHKELQGLHLYRMGMMRSFKRHVWIFIERFLARFKGRVSRDFRGLRIILIGSGMSCYGTYIVYTAAC